MVSSAAGIPILSYTFPSLSFLGAYILLLLWESDFLASAAHVPSISDVTSTSVDYTILT
jgi:hypothetical protein